MVIETNVTGIYVHAAYATDDKGTDFSLTSFPEAVYIGNYMDRSATESTDPNMYKWKPLYSDNVNPSDIEDDSEAYESVDVANVQDAVGVVSDAAAILKVRTDYNEDNLEKTQSTQDEGLGNLNLLVGTNQGDSNWTAGSATIASVTDPVYSDDPNDEIDTVLFTLTSATDTFTFDSGNLLDYIAANDEEENTYTLSYDIKVSNTSATMVPSVPSILTFDSPDFIDDPDDDFSDTWLHFASTAVISSTSGTDFQFTYSGSAADTVQIANLKIEAGALATPWRASLEEVEGVANTALSTANTANTNATNALNAAQAVANHFWYDTDGAHVTEVTETEWKDISDPNYHSGGNTLITSTGVSIRDGLTDLATFGASGAQVGQSGSGHTNIASSGLTVYGNNGSDLLANIGYGPGVDSGGGTSDAPFFTLGTRRAASTIGNNSLAEGYDNSASGYTSHAEGYHNIASNYAAHSEGAFCVSSGSEAHSEGYNCYSTANYAHSEGAMSQATAQASHAEGSRSIASAKDAHAQNTGTEAASSSQTTLGKYNVVDNASTYSVIIGNGTADNARSNALTVAWNGDTTTAGDVSAVDGNFSGDVSADNVSITTDLTVGGDSTVTGDVAAGSVTTTGTVTAADIAATTAAITSNLTAGGDITATGDLAGADATLTGTLTVGRGPTSNLEVATKKYVDDNSGGGGGWTPTYETIRNGISITTTSTNYGTNNTPLSNYKFIELRLYSSSAMSSELYPIETVKAQVNNVYINHGQTCRIGSSNVYLTWKYNDDTHLQMNVNSGSNYYVGIFGIK